MSPADFSYYAYLGYAWMIVSLGVITLFLITLLLFMMGLERLTDKLLKKFGMVKFLMEFADWKRDQNERELFTEKRK